MRKLASVLFLLLAVTANLFAQVGPTSGGGGSVSSGTAIGSCTSSLLYTDASTLLKCDPAAVVNGSVSTAGRSILTISDTISGSSATSNFLNITGAFPATLSSNVNGAYFSIAADNDAWVQSGLYSAVTGTGPGSGAIFGIQGDAAAASSAYNYGVAGRVSGNGTTGAGVIGLNYAGTNKIGGYFSLANENPPATSGALVINNAAVAANIFEARDNGTAVFTIADGGSLTSTAASMTFTGTASSGVSTPFIASGGTASSAGGLKLGAYDSSYGGFWSKNVTPAVANYALISNGASTIVNATSNVYLSINDVAFLQGNATATTVGVSTALGWSNNANPSIGTNDTFLSRESAAVVQMGLDVNGAAVNQTLKAHDGITGTDIKGASLTIAPGLGTGAAVSNPLTLNRVVTKATGTTAQTYSPAVVYCPTKILSNTSATAQTIATITTTSTTGGSVTMDYTTVANNGTLQDTDSGMVKVSWNNNAGTVAAAMTAVALQSDSDASGTLATTPTATVATNVVSIKFTPTWVTIVPTTVTGWATFTLHTSGDTVACQ